MKLFKLLSSGRRATLRLLRDRDLDAIIEWFIYSDESCLGNDFGVAIDYQARNKSRKLDNCCPLQGKLGFLVVDATTLALFQGLDPKCRFLELFNAEKCFFLVRLSADTDPILGGFVGNGYGSRRLRAPVFREDLPSPFIMQLPEAYEEFGVALCDETVVCQLRASKVSGFAIWDFEMRVEKMI